MTAAITVKLGGRGGTPYVPLSEVAPLVRRQISIDPVETYIELGVRSFHKGTFHRRTVKGADFDWQDLYRVQADDLVFSNIMAWEGAIALAGAEDDGCVGNHRMLTCEVDRRRVHPAFLAHYFRTPEGMRKLVGASTGTVARNRTLTAAALSRVTVPVPALTLQDRLVRHIEQLEIKGSAIDHHLDAAERDADHLLALRFRDLIVDAPRRPMAEVAPLVRREQPIDLDGTYPELGIRSFGKGTFHKLPLTGTEVGTKRLYRIEPGDLLFSNVFAWEGAIAIAQPADAGRFGSHRFITCLVVPELATAEFLRFYFLSDEGMSKIGEASPGGAGRNRTLGLEKLMAIEVPVPALSVLQQFDRLQAEVAALKVKHAAIREANAALLPATLERVFQSETAA